MPTAQTPDIDAAPVTRFPTTYAVTAPGPQHAVSRDFRILTFSLPFCAPRQFPALWTRIIHGLLPGGIFAGQLFGIRDSWADDPDMSFHNREEVTALLDGL